MKQQEVGKQNPLMGLEGESHCTAKPSLVQLWGQSTPTHQVHGDAGGGAWPAGLRPRWFSGEGGQGAACLSLHTTRASGKEVDSMYRCFFSSLQLHQFNCSSKVTGFCPATSLPHDPPDLGLLLPERGKQPLELPLPPWGLKPEVWGWSALWN